MQHKDILSQAARSTGMTVPEGYFADFSRRMAEALPRQDWEATPKVMPRTWWQRTRPYIYMAAMFLGVWCMMKMFDFMRPSHTNMSIDSHPAIAAAISNDAFYEDFVVPTFDEGALLDELYEAGFDTTDLAE
ncbi:MAG: hypothetical protein NC043_07850 [Muribaculaceae bacterium]|nr:hypothetical protein [Muribaculaceae bacterium]